MYFSLVLARCPPSATVVSSGYSGPTSGAAEFVDASSDVEYLAEAVADDSVGDSYSKLEVEY